jgi:hypothetical protein
VSFPFPNDPPDDAALAPITARCTCKWECDPFESFPKPPYLAELDEACVQHGRVAQPETWRKVDEIDGLIDEAIAAGALPAGTLPAFDTPMALDAEAWEEQA